MKVICDSKKSISVTKLKFTIVTALVLASFGFSNAQVTSTFGVDAEGWTMSDINLNTPFTVNHNSAGGNPGGYVSASGASSQPYYFTSPAKFNGNLIYFSYGQDLKFDIQINHTPTAHSAYGDVIVQSNSGSYLTLTLPSFPAVAPAWSTFTIRLDETSNWRINSTGGPIATKKQVLQFLLNVQSIRINVNYGTAVLTGAIDNVILQKRSIETAPSITSFTPSTGKPGTSVTINGSNFGSSISQNAVYFGNMEGVITNATSSQLTVTVPVGATFGQITVLNKTSGLVKQSELPFSPGFDDGGRIIPATFKSKFDFPTTQSGGVSIGDLDGDGWSDIIMAWADNSKVEVYRNLGLGGKLSATSFAPKVTFLTNQFFTNGAGIEVVDLDGDGKLDLTTSAWNGAGFGGGVFVTFRNISTPGTITFETAETWDGVTDESPVYDVTDIDGDGLPELIGGEGGSGGTFWINQNMSTPGNIDFAPPATFLGGAVIGNVNTVTDLDNDGKPELIVKQASTITIIKNTSTPGAISLGSTVILPYSGDSNVELYDFNGDGKKDLIFGNFYTGDDIRIHINTNSGGALAIGDFATEIIVKSELSYTNSGITLADMNGDGKVEIVAVDHGNIGVFENITNGTFTANSFIEAYVKDGGNGSTYPNKLVVGDLNGDGKPDIVMATTNASWRITVFENSNVQAPHISLNTVSPLKGAVGSNVTITGDYFSTTPSQNTVMFGDVKATVTSATKKQLIVTVPPGASMAAVSVTRDQLTSTYHLPFVPTFSPGVNFNNTHFATPIDFTLT
ncbi:MAG: FG-GAP-like repeat-containing protein, partial [Chryseolinea sp.]